MRSSFDSIKKCVALLPPLPGVYRFYDKDGVIIYIGKAKNLKNRVSQYFNSRESLSIKTRVMVDKIASFQHTVVESEEDALLLENNLIKEYQPRYNIMLKDGKTYPWICIKKEPFPRVFTTRRVVKDGSLYFGPYSSAIQAKEMVELLSSLFYLRDCKLNLAPEIIAQNRYRPCLNYHIGKCKAPCISLFTLEEYQEQIEQIVSLLKGEGAALAREFKEKMKQASDAMKFEEAQTYKRRLELLNNHYSKSIIVNQSVTNVDVFGLVVNDLGCYGSYLRVVNGSIVQSLNLEIKVPIEEESEAIMSRFITEMHSQFGEKSKELIVSVMPDSGYYAAKSHVPQRGDKRYLLELSLKNASLFSKERQKQEENLRPLELKEKILERLRADLNMTLIPNYIECFDNSNIQGSNPVAACVVFRDGVPSKKEYRHFNIKSVTGPDDYASMREVIGRRYSRILREGGELPQLVIIDGGKGQLSSAFEVLKELNIENKFKIIGIAERLEELIIPGDSHPLFLDKSSPSLKLIMQIRDEAHRFGITHHRNLRSKAQIASTLSSIPGVGQRSEQKLLKTYGSLKVIKEQSQEELAKIVGKRVAEAIFNFLSKA